MKLEEIVDDLKEQMNDWGHKTPKELFDDFELTGDIYMSSIERDSDGRYHFYCGLSIDGGLSDTLTCCDYIKKCFARIGLTCEENYKDRNRKFDVNVSGGDFFCLNNPLGGDYKGTLKALKKVFKSDGFSVEVD